MAAPAPRPSASYGYVATAIGVMSREWGPLAVSLPLSRRGRPWFWHALVRSRRDGPGAHVLGEFLRRPVVQRPLSVTKERPWWDQTSRLE